MCPGEETGYTLGQSLESADSITLDKWAGGCPPVLTALLRRPKGTEVLHMHKVVL